MKFGVKAVWAGIGLGMLAMAAAPAFADEWNQETTVTFNQPVEIPGHVLLPGSYDFRLADLTDRHVVEVFKEEPNGKERFVAAEMAIPDYRPEPTDKPVITFEERRKTNPEAIHSWFYPGETIGSEFLYPRSERLRPAI